MNKKVQDPKVEINIVNPTQGKSGNKKLQECRQEPLKHNKIQDMEYRIQGITDMTKNWDTLVKENVKSKKFLA